jgi:hypothetical protein
VAHGAAACGAGGGHCHWSHSDRAGNTNGPSFTALSESPATGDVDAGKKAALTLTASEALKVTGTPTLTLNDSGVATYDKAHSTSTSLVFDHTSSPDILKRVTRISVETMKMRTEKR